LIINLDLSIVKRSLLTSYCTVHCEQEQMVGWMAPFSGSRQMRRKNLSSNHEHMARVAMDSLIFTRDCHALPFYALWASHPWKGLKTISGKARPHGGWPAAVFYPLGHPKPYAHASNSKKINTFPVKKVKGRGEAMRWCHVVSCGTWAWLVSWCLGDGRGHGARWVLDWGILVIMKWCLGYYRSRLMTWLFLLVVEPVLWSFWDEIELLLTRIWAYNGGSHD
jgi:hypothetical protein